MGGLNLGGSMDPVYNAVSVAELAVEMAIKITVQYFTDSRDALVKALAD